MSVVVRAKQLDLPSNSYIVVGSGILDALGIREARDIDLCVDENLYADLKNKGWEEQQGAEGKHLIKGDVEVWLYFDSVNFEKLKEKSVVIDDINFLTLDYVKDWKTRKGREKDKKDVQLIDAYIVKRS